MSKKITVKDVVKAATKIKPTSVKQIKSFADKEFPECEIRIKDINQYLYGECYDGVTYGSVERMERIL